MKNSNNNIFISKKVKTVFGKTIVLFFISTLTLFVGCNKSDSSDEAAATGSGFISATIDGVAFRGTTINDYLTNKFFISFIANNTSEKKGMNIYISRDKAIVGTTFNFPFVLGADEDVAVNAIKIGDNGLAIPEENIPIYGSMTFTKVTKTEIEGTFTGTTSDDKTVTNGKFTLVYSKVWE